MKKSANQLVGICGLYCGTCPKYLAYQDQDKDELQKMAHADKVSVEEIRCDGCLSDHIYPTCRDCRHGFRRCAEEKKVTWCFQCPEFPCKRLEDFSKIHQVNGIWHHKEVIKNLQFMKDRGVEEWIKQQDKEGACPGCGKMLYWHSLKCPRCGLTLQKK
jgi:hypothetical protein